MTGRSRPKASTRARNTDHVFAPRSDSLRPNPSRRRPDGKAGAARDLRTTGAIAPSGTALARALTEPVRAQASRPPAVLEAGCRHRGGHPGADPRLSRGSRLDIVEANPRFAARLRHLVATHPGLAGRPGRVDVHQVERIMTRSLELLHPGGTLTYFAYLGTRRARARTASRAEARRHAAVDEVMAAYQRAYATGRWTVWANLPPAHVWHLRGPLAPDDRTGTRPEEARR